MHQPAVDTQAELDKTVISDRRGRPSALISTVSPSTFVPADDNIFAPVAHSSVWLMTGVVAGALGLGLLVWCLRPVPKAKAWVVVVADRPAIKAHYLAAVDDIRAEYDAHHLDERELHHRLSRTVREFASQIGAPGAMAMTASLLDQAGLQSVAKVVAGYQEPQFKQRPRSDPATSCERAKGVIATW